MPPGDAQAVFETEVKRHGYFYHHCSFGRGMAYFYRVVVFIASCVFAVQALASFPPSSQLPADVSSRWAQEISDAKVNCGYGFQYYCYSIGACPPAWAGDRCLLSGFGAVREGAYLVQSCPSNSSLDAGACSCGSGYVQNSTLDACRLPPGGCQAGISGPTTHQAGWFPDGGLVGVYTAQNALVTVGGCMTGMTGSDGRMGGSGGCSVTYSSSAAPQGAKGSNGSSSYTFFLTGTTTGSACTPLPPPTLGPEPPCTGQSGMIDGKTVCLAKQTPAQAAAQAAAVAQAAAQAASIAATNSGATASVAAAAASAAGNAAAAALAAGATPEAAAAAGAAAGAAAVAAQAANKTPEQVKSESSVAGVVQTAAARAQAIATAAGASSTVISQAVASASAAAATAAANVLTNGGTYAQAAQAAAIAGQTATASVLVGSSNAVAQAEGAAAASGQRAGMENSPGGTGGANGSLSGEKKDEPVADFCKTNPQAKMCKTEFDGEFSGACGAPPVCKGDAIMCAIAAATFATNCLLKDPNKQTPLYDAAIAKTGDQTTSLPGNSTINISPASFDQTELLGGASGMSDRTVTVMGSTIALPFSSVNVWLARLGVILQACAFLLCARIVTRG